MTSGQCNQMARLFAALEYGEKLAHDCAIQQRRLIEDRRSRRFLQVQALQETAHAALFRKAADWLAPNKHYSPPPAMLRFGIRLQNALACNDLTESLVASQIVLEGLGEQILVRLNHGMDRHGIGFRRQRCLLLRQEQGHYAFGLRTLEQRLQLEHCSVEHVQQLACDYLSQIQRITTEMADVFTVLDEDADEYYHGLLAALPPWLDPDRQEAVTGIKT